MQFRVFLIRAVSASQLFRVSFLVIRVFPHVPGCGFVVSDPNIPWGFVASVNKDFLGLLYYTYIEGLQVLVTASKRQRGLYSGRDGSELLDTYFEMFL